MTKPARTTALTALLCLASLAGTARAEDQHLEALRKAATDARQDVAAQVAYGRALIKADKLGPAETQMKHVLNLHRGSIEGMYELARVKFAEGNYKTARAYCKTLAAKDAEHVLSDVCMARAYLVWRRASRAFDHINAAIAKNPHHVEALLALGDARRMEGNRDAAKSAYEDAAKADPTNAEPYLGLGRLYLVLGTRAEAKTAFEQALALDEDDPEIQLELGKLLKGDAGAKLLARALLARPDWPEARLALARAKLDAGEVDSALGSFEQILKKEPNNVGASLGVALALMAKKDYAAAEPALVKALELQPNDPDATLALAELYRHTDRHEEAFNQYRTAAGTARMEPGPFIAAADLALSIDRTLLAAAFLEKALEREPNSARALAMYARVLADRGDRAAARDYYQRALNGSGDVDRAAIQAALAKLK